MIFGTMLKRNRWNWFFFLIAFLIATSLEISLRPVLEIKISRNACIYTNMQICRC